MEENKKLFKKKKKNKDFFKKKIRTRLGGDGHKELGGGGEQRVNLKSPQF